MTLSFDRPATDLFPEDYREIVMRLREGALDKRWYFDSHRRIEEAHKSRSRAAAALLGVVEFFRRAVRETTKSVGATTRELRRIHTEADDLQKSQRPLMAAISCVDSRVRAHDLLQARLGESLQLVNVGGSVESENDPQVMDHSAAKFLSFAVGTMKVTKIMLLTHGLCGCIANADSSVWRAAPPNLNAADKLIYDMAQQKRHLLAMVRENGEDFYLSKLPHKAIAPDAAGRRLQALELAHAEHTRALTERFAEDVLEGAIKPRKIFSVYFDLRNMGVYLRHPDTGNYVPVMEGARLLQRPSAFSAVPANDVCDEPDCTRPHGVSAGRLKLYTPRG